MTSYPQIISCCLLPEVQENGSRILQVEIRINDQWIISKQRKILPPFPTSDRPIEFEAYAPCTALGRLTEAQIFFLKSHAASSNNRARDSLLDHAMQNGWDLFPKRIYHTLRASVHEDGRRLLLEWIKMNPNLTVRRSVFLRPPFFYPHSVPFVHPGQEDHTNYDYEYRYYN
jgi:hypothetical protein